MGGRPREQRGPVHSTAGLTNACPTIRRPSPRSRLEHAKPLVTDVRINRDVAIHRGGAPSPDVSVEGNRERHFERVMEFYMDKPGLGGRVPFSFGEELALAKLIGYWRMLREVEFGSGSPCLARP